MTEAASEFYDSSSLAEQPPRHLQAVPDLLPELAPVQAIDKTTAQWRQGLPGWRQDVVRAYEQIPPGVTGPERLQQLAQQLGQAVISYTSDTGRTVYYPRYY